MSVDYTVLASPLLRGVRRNADSRPTIRRLQMMDHLEIPDLDDPFLMELSVCAKVRTRNSRLLSEMKKLNTNRMTALVGDFVKGEAELYAQIFGGGEIKNHLHVNVLIRPNGWQKKAFLSSVRKVQDAARQFFGLSADLIIRGEFLIPISELPKKCFIRDARKETRIAGMKANRTGENFVFKNHPFMYRLRWADFGKDHVVVMLDVNQTMKIETGYLQKSKSAVLKAFRTLIFTGKHNAITN
jgi:hypothetical protein